VTRPAALAASALAAALAIAASPARADPANLRFDTRADVPLTVGLGALWLSSELAFKSALAPKEPRWTMPDRTDTAVSRLHWADTGAADTLSDVLLFGATPLWALSFAAAAGGARDSNAEAGQNVVLVLESGVTAMTLNQIAKFVVGRQRPCAHFNPAPAAAAPAAERPCHAQPSDDNLSWFSGHATFTASLAVSSGMIASMRGYSAAPAVWAGGALLSLTTGYLRIAADKHYLSDVVTGWILGSAAGVLVPLLHQGSTASPPPVSAPASGAPLALAPHAGSPAVIGFSGVW
jgi:membrane-associated phospholipid phosphatase